MDQEYTKRRKKARPIEVRVPRFPASMLRRMERESDREDRIREGAMKATKVMPKTDKKRLRVRPNSDCIMRLEAAYKLAKRDIKRRLLKLPPLEPESRRELEEIEFWDFAFELTALADSPRQAKIWAAILLSNNHLRARWKTEKTCPELKALFDFLTQKDFLRYDKAMRVYRLAPRYFGAVRLMRGMEVNILNQLFRLRIPIRER